ncbi:MAG: hypothetical protein CVU89_05470 [Firmicutes bacterium HGW-Firmicutes-14]|nr:MAG: hypothetical protein CVU89_05470 [Firmicutes bacterium HGW-Firmicutes-14]
MNIRGNIPSEQKHYTNLYLFYLAVLFLTIVIPKAGDKMAGIPVTAASLLFGALILSAVPVLKKIKLPIIEKVYLLYMTLVLAVPWVFISPDTRTYFKIVLPLFVPLAVFYWINPVTQALVNNRTRLLQVLRAAAAGIIIIVIYGYIQRVFGHYRTIIPGLTMLYTDAVTPEIFYLKKNLVDVAGSAEKWYKVTSTYQNGNLFGITVVMLMFPVMAAFLHVHEVKDRILFGTASLLAFSIIPFTLARSALFGTMVGVTVVFFVFKGLRKKTAVVSLVMLIFFIITCSPFMTHRMLLSFFDLSMNGRVERMKIVAGAVDRHGEDLVAQSGDRPAERPAVKKSPRLVQKVLGLGFKRSSMQVKDFFDYYTENIYFTIYVFTGLLGVVLFLAVAANTVIPLGRYVLSHPPDTVSGVAGGVLAGLTAYLAQGFVDGGISFLPVGFVFWFLVGLARALMGQQKTQGYGDFLCK